MRHNELLHCLHANEAVKTMSFQCFNWKKESVVAPPCGLLSKNSHYRLHFVF